MDEQSVPSRLFRNRTNPHGVRCPMPGIGPIELLLALLLLALLLGGLWLVVRVIRHAWDSGKPRPPKM